MARVRVTGPARRDLQAIRRYIATDSPDRAQAVIDRILDRCAQLGVAPGRVRDDGPPIAGEVRSVPVSPYVVLYRIAPGNAVEVLRVIDGRRDLATVFPVRAVGKSRAGYLRVDNRAVSTSGTWPFSYA